MAQLLQLRQKIKAKQNIKKITHALRLVSMSLYNKLDKQNIPLTYYTQHVKHFFAKLLAQNPSWNQPVLFPQDPHDSTPLLIVIATTKGLCGSLNSNLFRSIESNLHLAPHQKPTVITIGQRALKFVQEQNLGNVLCTYPELNSNNFIALADDLVDKIINIHTPYSSVTFFHNTAPSFFMQKPMRNNLIPLQLEQVKNNKSKESAAPIAATEIAKELIWEQPSVDILNYLAIRYLRSSVIQILFQALRAEHAARFLAMENATSNAEKYLEQLTLQMNKLRQTLITKEVAELSSLAPGR